MFSFPLLTNEEILTCLKELEFSISEEELRDPERHRVAIRVVLEQLMEMCVGVTREDLSTAKVSVGRESICYPELHEESITELALFRAVCDMMKVCGVSDFGLRDWFTPTPKRLRKNLSAVLNFAKYREDMLIAYKQLCDWRDSHLKVVADARSEAEGAAAELQSLEFATGSDRAEAGGVACDCDAMEREAAALEAARAERAARADDLDAALRAATDARAGHAADLEARRAACEALEATCDASESPDELRGAIDVAVARLKAHDDAVADEARRVSDVREALASLTEVQVDMSRAADAVLAIERDLEAQKEAVKDLRALEARAASRRDDLHELGKCLKTAEANADHVNEKLKYHVEAQHLKSARATDALKALQDDLRQMDADRAARIAQRRDLDRLEHAFAADVARQKDDDHAADLWIAAAAQNLEHLVKATTATPAPRAVLA